MNRPRTPGRRGEQRGAVAVEAALITPLLLIFVFGIIEFSLLLRDSAAVGSAARVGSRMASTAAGAGVGECLTGPEAPPCTPTNTPALAQVAADAIQRAGSAMPADSVEYIWVYRANAQGFPGTATSMDGASCGVDCVEFAWNDATDRFRYASGSWQPATINACLNNVNSMTVGVYVRARHDFLTGLFGDGVDIDDRSVMKFEPLPNESCLPGTRAMDNP